MDVRRLFQATDKVARAKAYYSHRCEGNISGKVARDSSTFLRFLEGNFLRKSLTGPYRIRTERLISGKEYSKSYQKH